MKIFPAIDLKDGKCVRLNKGDYKQVTHYSDNPLEMAETWISQGANNLHIVDLDGAKAGKPINFTIIESIRKEFPNLFIQVGGGIRNQENINRYINAKIDKVIIGTKVVTDPEFIKKIDANILNRIVVDVAVKDEMLAVQGWNESSSYNIKEFISILNQNNISEIVFTDVSKDGMLQGINLEKIKEILDFSNIPLIASGGVTSIKDIENLKKLKDKGLSGIIIGKALYENKISLPEAIKIAEN
jgi:phosphoribosylformimino-5-aminoimidazole carboxamide ribotide isomerase